MKEERSLAEIAAYECFKKGHCLEAKRLIESSPRRGAESYFGSNLWNATNVILREKRISFAKESLNDEQRALLENRTKRVLGIWDLRMCHGLLGIFFFSIYF